MTPPVVVILVVAAEKHLNLAVAPGPGGAVRVTMPAPEEAPESALRPFAGPGREPRAGKPSGAEPGGRCGQVLALLRARQQPLKSAEIAAKLGCPRKAATDALAYLARKGLANQTPEGWRAKG